MILDSSAQKHYDAGREHTRLHYGPGRLELERTKELIERHLPRRECDIADIGGANGTYAFWLARKNHRVHLLDAVPLHIEQAREAATVQSGNPLESMEVGDARALPYADASMDAVLMLGPLYHLTERADRLRAWREALRVLRPGGLVFAAGISRFASALDGLTRGLIADSLFLDIAKQDLSDGQHRNPGDHPEYFATAYFHHPDELRTEAMEAGFVSADVFAIEGPVWMLSSFERYWQDTELKARMMGLLKRMEKEPALLGASAHLLGVTRKPI